MKDFWNKLEENLIVVFMALVTLLILAGWICEDVAPDSVKAMNQMAMIAYAWIVFLAIAYSAKKGLFMKLDVISSHYSEKTRNALDLLMNVILFLVCLFFFVLGIRQLQEMIAAGEVYKETGIPMVRDLIGLRLLDTVWRCFVLLYRHWGRNRDKERRKIR